MVCVLVSNNERTNSMPSMLILDFRALQPVSVLNLSCVASTQYQQYLIFAAGL
jgi:hypothetical protein